MKSLLKKAFLCSITFYFLNCNDAPKESALATKQNETSTKHNKKPNIIIVLTDDQGWADVGFNGATDIPTDNLDRLANQGVIFSNGYVSHPYCSPSRAGILTGRYQARFGHDCNMPYQGENDNTVGTPLSEKMISEALKEQGYKTAAIGKWHVGDHPDLHPNAQGFDHWFGFAGGGMNFWGIPKSPINKIVRNGKDVSQDELSYLTDDFTEEAINFITKEKDNPFFIYLAYNAPHAPDHATEQYLENTKHIEYGGRSVYAAMVNGVDIGVGKIDSTLIANGIKDNTIIAFLSDNGGRKEHADNRPNRGHKGMIFEGGIKVPFFISWPAGIKSNQTYNNPIISLDLFPTFLNAAGGNINNEPQLEGVNLLPYIEGKNTNRPHEKLFWRSVGGFEYAARINDYKLYKSAYKGKTLLFDLKNDPLERNDIAQSNPEIVSKLEKAYVEWNSKNLDPGWVDPHPENVIKEEQRLQETRKKSLNNKR
ncbi:sulfatase-like hydrolase/transferase [Seonamhaeicola algicola]|uniref:Sulfatase-like hydrolase/transferase n=1 Tax=Seonamhaeicola algicola TaxID=1719036 RepID=A0A5C7AEQ6_9FLAO|nr:sulfatase-like hydrolase/transferase [Seonamhaeicola algicola]TXE07236.1 sulfatase-like hydrolase/transferase [Seonamhaeicola algicola]